MNLQIIKEPSNRKRTCFKIMFEVLINYPNGTSSYGIYGNILLEYIKLFIFLRCIPFDHNILS